MALVPSAAYPGQIATDANYPQGKARNVTVAGDGTGTPLEQAWVNDLFGFEQALLAAASVTPSGTPDRVGASDYLTALNAIIAAAVAPLLPVKQYAQSTVSGSVLSTGANLVMTALSPNVGVFTIATNQIQVPAAGDYLIMVSGSLKNTDTTSGRVTTVQLAVGGSTVQTDDVSRIGTTAADEVPFAFNFIATIATPSTQKISLSLVFAGGGTVSIFNANLTVRRLA